MRTSRSLAAVAAALVALIGCTSSETGAPTAVPAPGDAGATFVEGSALVTGVVTTVDGTPLQGATVFLRYCTEDRSHGGHLFEDITDSAGVFALEDVPAGAQVLVARLQHYIRYEATIEVPESGELQLEIVLERNVGDGKPKTLPSESDGQGRYGQQGHQH